MDISSYSERVLDLSRLLNALVSFKKDKALTQKVPEVDKYMAYFQRHAVWGVPADSWPDKLSFTSFPGPIFPHLYEAKEAPLTLVVARVEDAILGGVWAYRCCWPAQFSYRSSEGLVVVFHTYSEETATARACALLHDLGHVLRAVKEGRAGRPIPKDWTEDKRLQEEADMHFFDAKVFRALAGHLYERAMAEPVQIIQEQLQKEVKPVLLKVDPRFLDAVLEPAPSTAALSDRATQLVIQFHLIAFELAYGSTAPKKRAELMKALYEAIGWK